MKTVTEIEMQPLSAGGEQPLPLPELKLENLDFKVDLPVLILPSQFISALSEPVFSPQELMRVPKKLYRNPWPENAKEDAVGVFPDEIWIHLFRYAEIETLMALMLTCKKMAHLMNNGAVRERLYAAQQFHFFKPFITSAAENFIPAVPLPAAGVQVQLLQAPSEELYHDGPQGFIMRRG